MRRSKKSQQTDPANSGGFLLLNTYDADDRLTATTDALSHTTTTVYDLVGNVTVSIDANNNRTTYTYDGRNRLVAVTDPLLHTTSFGYDSGGNRITVTDPLGNVTTTAYDALNRATTVTDARTGLTVSAYDAAGRLVSLTDPVGNRTTYAYDAADRVTTVTDPLSHTTTFLYDSGGELVDRTDRDGRRVTFAYDPGGRRTNERWLTSSGGTIRTVTSTYDNAGQLTGVTDPDSTLAFSYDSGGHQLTADNAGTAGQPRVLLTSAYDQDGQRTGLADNLATAGVTTFAYDAAHRLTTITRAFGGTAGPQFVYGYDPADRLTALTRQIGPGSISGGYVQVATTFAYDNADRLTTLTHRAVTVLSGGGTLTVPLATYTYGYDNGDRLTSESNAEGAVTYGYDATNQLTGTSGARSESYTYDSGGNRTMTGYTTGTANELSAAGGYTFTYDGEGNLASKTLTATGDKTDFTWDDRNRLTGVIRHNALSVVTMQATYTYDALDRRIGTNVDADGAGVGLPVQTWTVYDGQDTYADFGGLGTLQERYLYGPAVDALLARTDVTGTTAWYLTDKLGSVRDIASPLGLVIDHVAYDSYGKVTGETAPALGDRFKFTGRELDAATGLYYDRARYYDAATGRFVSQDPSGFAAGDADLYRYVGNGPANGTDPSGTEFQATFPLGSIGAEPPGFQIVAPMGPGLGAIIPLFPKLPDMPTPPTVPETADRTTEEGRREWEKYYEELDKYLYELNKYYLEKTSKTSIGFTMDLDGPFSVTQQGGSLTGDLNLGGGTSTSIGIAGNPEGPTGTVSFPLVPTTPNAPDPGKVGIPIGGLGGVGKGGPILDPPSSVLAPGGPGHPGGGSVPGSLIPDLNPPGDLLFSDPNIPTTAVPEGPSIGILDPLARYIWYLLSGNYIPRTESP